MIQAPNKSTWKTALGEKRKRRKSLNRSGSKMLISISKDWRIIR
jgi:hypothetical protein